MQSVTLLCKDEASITCKSLETAPMAFRFASELGSLRFGLDFYVYKTFFEDQNIAFCTTRHP